METKITGVEFDAQGNVKRFAQAVADLKTALAMENLADEVAWR